MCRWRIYSTIKSWRRPVRVHYLGVGLPEAIRVLQREHSLPQRDLLVSDACHSTMYMYSYSSSPQLYIALSTFLTAFFHNFATIPSSLFTLSTSHLPYIYASSSGSVPSACSLLFASSNAHVSMLYWFMISSLSIYRDSSPRPSGIL